MIFGRVGCVTSNIRLQFGGDPDHDTDPGIFVRNYYHHGTGAIVVPILLLTQEAVDDLLSFLRSGMSH